MKSRINIFLVLLFSLVALPAQAALQAGTQFSAEPEREQILNPNPRQQLARQMIELGVTRDDASRRVAQLTDTEVRKLQGQMQQLPAGAGVSTTNLLLIIILVILIL